MKLMGKAGEDRCKGLEEHLVERVFQKEGTV